MLRRTELSIGYSGLLYAGRLPLLFVSENDFKRLAHNVSRLLAVQPWTIVMSKAVLR